MLPGVKNCGCVMVDLVGQFAIPVLSGKTYGGRSQMFVIMSRMAQRSVDVLCDNQRGAQRPFAVIFCSAPRVAEHRLLYAKANSAAYGAVAWPAVYSVFPTSYAVFAAATTPRPRWTQFAMVPPKLGRTAFVFGSFN